ncbi:MAG: hypothetical protein ABIO70_35095 [Pseudomonadota bacterium]
MIRHLIPPAALALTACQEPPAQHGCWYDLVIVPADAADLDAVGQEAADLACTQEGDPPQWACTPPSGSFYENEEACQTDADTLGQALTDAGLQADLSCRCAAED